MKNYKKDTPKIMLSVSILITLFVLLFIKPIAQDTHYHQFANDTCMWGINNFWNVISNMGFVAAGIYGFIIILKYQVKNPIIWVLFSGIILTGIGSAYYHYSPNHQTLVWDRLPMTIVFTAYFSFIYQCYFSEKIAWRIWIFSLLTGIISVFYWQFTETMHRGDLRLYAIVQFLPMILILLIVSLHHSENKHLWKPLLCTILWYIIAKFLEYNDQAFFEYTHLVSGHPLKHMAASIATFYIAMTIKATQNHK